MLIFLSLIHWGVRRCQRGPILAGFALHLPVLDREIDLSRAGIAVHDLELGIKQTVGEHCCGHSCPNW